MAIVTLTRKEYRELLDIKNKLAALEADLAAARFERDAAREALEAADPIVEHVRTDFKNECIDGCILWVNKEGHAAGPDECGDPYCPWVNINIQLKKYDEARAVIAAALKGE